MNPREILESIPEEVRLYILDNYVWFSMNRYFLDFFPLRSNGANSRNPYLDLMDPSSTTSIIQNLFGTFQTRQDNYQREYFCLFKNINLDRNGFVHFLKILAHLNSQIQYLVHWFGKSIHSISLQDLSMLQFATVQRIATCCPHLSYLNINNCSNSFHHGWRPFRQLLLELISKSQPIKWETLSLIYHFAATPTVLEFLMHSHYNSEEAQATHQQQQSQIRQWLQHLPLKTLHLTCATLYKEDYLSLLEHAHQLKTLTLNCLDNTCMIEGILVNKSLSTLRIENFNLNPLQLELLLTAMCEHPNLTSIYLHGGTNTSYLISAPKFILHYKNGSHLLWQRITSFGIECTQVANDKMTPQEMEKLTDLSQFTHLQKVSLWLPIDSPFSIANCFSSFQPITHLELQYFSLDDDMCYQILHTLWQLQYLHLDSCKVTGTLFTELKRSPCYALKGFSMRNSFHFCSFHSIGQAFPSLEQLCCNNCSLLDDSCITEMEPIPSLLELDLCNDSLISDKSAEWIAKRQLFVNLQSIKTTGTKITYLGHISLVNELRYLKRLQCRLHVPSQQDVYQQHVYFKYIQELEQFTNELIANQDLEWLQLD